MKVQYYKRKISSLKYDLAKAQNELAKNTMIEEKYKAALLELDEMKL